MDLKNRYFLTWENSELLYARVVVKFTIFCLQHVYSKISFSTDHVFCFGLVPCLNAGLIGWYWVIVRTNKNRLGCFTHFPASFVGCAYPFNLNCDWITTLFVFCFDFFFRFWLVENCQLKCKWYENADFVFRWLGFETWNFPYEKNLPDVPISA